LSEDSCYNVSATDQSWRCSVGGWGCSRVRARVLQQVVVRCGRLPAALRHVPPVP